MCDFSIYCSLQIDCCSPPEPQKNILQLLSQFQLDTVWQVNCNWCAKLMECPFNMCLLHLWSHHWWLSPIRGVSAHPSIFDMHLMSLVDLWFCIRTTITFFFLVAFMHCNANCQGTLNILCVADLKRESSWQKARAMQSVLKCQNQGSRLHSLIYRSKWVIK